MNNRIGRYRTMIDTAPQLKLTPIQIGTLWARMASDYQDLANFPEAEVAYGRALTLFEHDPDGHENDAITLGNLGSLYSITGRFDAEENCRKRSLAIFEKLGDTLQIARARAHLADGYLVMGKNKLAEKYASQALHAMAELPNATYEDKGSALVTFAYATCLTGHCDNGLRAAREARGIVSTAFAPESAPAGQTHVALGYLEQKTGDGLHAEDDLREGIRILRLNLPPFHPLLTHALVLYRDYLAENHRDVEAKRVTAEVQSATAQTAGCTACTVSVHGLRPN
jgi:tetratricopeptide (TPR) repeat protein